MIRFILNKRKNPDRPKPNKNQTITNEDHGPTGIDKMMADVLGSDATVEEAEALLEPIDEYENQLENNAPTLSKADELLHSQKLDLNAILNGLKENENTDKE